MTCNCIEGFIFKFVLPTCSFDRASPSSAQFESQRDKRLGSLPVEPQHQFARKCLPAGPSSHQSAKPLGRPVQYGSLFTESRSRLCHIGVAIANGSPSEQHKQRPGCLKQRQHKEQQLQRCWRRRRRWFCWRRYYHYQQHARNDATTWFGHKWHSDGHCYWSTALEPQGTLSMRSLLRTPAR